MPISTYKFPFVKVSATGNDFLLIDLLDPKKSSLWKEEFSALRRSDLVQVLCERHEGMGADGVVILEPDSDCDFVWDFFNSDGSAAEMCGNAARAVSFYVFAVTRRPDIRFRTRVGIIAAKVHSADDIEVTLPPIKEHNWGDAFDFVRAGVPHVVIRKENLDHVADLTSEALEIKRLKQFQKDGTNVTFIHVLSASHIQSKTFERGVEGFTRSCGTGAIAAAYSILRGEENRVVQVDVPGGSLSVVWKKGVPILRGPAKIVGEMHWAREK